MSLIHKEISDFSVQAYQNGAFHTVTKADVLGKWGVFFFYPADFTFVCPAELEDLSDAVEERRLRDETGFGTLAESESESESSTPRRYSPILPIIYPL